MMRLLLNTSLVLSLALPGAGPGPRRPTGEPSPPPRDEPERLAMSPPIVCDSIAGFGDYVRRAEPAYHKDEKLLVYCQPSNFQIEKSKDQYRASLVQDATLRRRQEKTPLWKKEGIVEYEPKGEYPPLQVYLATSVSLKGLSPGEYTLELVLRDRLGRGRPATQTLTFRVISAPKPASPPPDEAPAVKTDARPPKSEH